jgi:DNA-directed RNA polymerase subunit K/omega
MEPDTVQEDPGEVVEPIEPAPPIQNRFLFVDIAAQRAKQLRRGARSRLGPAGSESPSAAYRPDVPHKPERVAMEEVRRGLVQYTLAQVKGEHHEAEP